MRFALPAGLAAGALAGPLVLWYVLRSRRPRQVVASTLLWRATERSVAAALPWQRFSPDRTFWLVLGALLLGALALARPTIPVAAELGDHTVLIVDTSASMGADEAGETRLALAVREANRLIADLGPAQTASVIEAAGRGRVLVSGAGDAAAARRALADLEPTHGSADLADAFALAAAVEQPGETTVVHLLTDAAPTDEAAAVAPAGLRVHAVGSDLPNLAVTRVEALSSGAGSATVFVGVRNFGLVESGATVTVSVDGAEVVRRTLTLGSRASEDLVLSVPAPAGSGVVEASVAPSGPAPDGPARDALAIDDRAIAVVAGARDVEALVVGPGNLFLSAALSAVPGVRVGTATAVPASLEGIDLLVVDRAAAPEALTVPTILVGPQRSPAGIAMGAAVELPAVTFQAPQHPLLADVDLAGLAIASARPVDAPALESVVSGPAGTLVAAGRLDRAPVVHISFDLLESNLPLQVAWPVLVANAVTWLTVPPAAAPLTVGDEAVFAVPAGAEGVVVRSPAAGDGATAEELHLDVTRPRVEVDRPGLWTAQWAGPQVEGLPPPAPVPVNVPPSESDLSRPRPSGQAGPGETAAAALPGEGERSLARELLAIGLALLLLDALLRGRSRRRRLRGAPVTATPAAPTLAKVGR